MAKARRLAAVLQGKTFATDITVQEDIVKNMLESDKLAIKAKLGELEVAKKNALQLIADPTPEKRTKGLNDLFQAFYDEKDLKEQSEIHKAVEKYLNEETEVSE